MTSQTVDPESQIEIIPDEDNDTASLYGDDIVKLHLNGRIFTAHRKALSGKSPVFKKQLKKLKANEFLEVPNMEESIFEQLLSYVYRGTVDSVVLKENAVQLWIAADKYQMDQLMQRCESSLCPYMISTTVIDILLLSHRHKIVRLKKQAIEYICNNSQQVMEQTDKWSHLVANSDITLWEELLGNQSPIETGGFWHLLLNNLSMGVWMISLFLAVVPACILLIFSVGITIRAYNSSLALGSMESFAVFFSFFLFMIFAAPMVLVFLIPCIAGFKCL